MPNTSSHAAGLRLAVHKIAANSAALDSPQPPGLAAARVELSRFVRDRAEHCAADIGFTWVGTSDAPSTYASLLSAYARSAASGSPLPINSDATQTSILIGSESTIALRFWHDVSHVRRSLTFSSVDEINLALWHVAVAETEGLSDLSVRLLEADLVGHALLYAAAKTYPLDQKRFVLESLTFGVADAILMEVERQRFPSKDGS